MSGPTGLSGQLGFSPETEYGVIVTPAKFMEFLPGETLKRTQNFMRSAGIKAGRMFQTGSRTQPTTRTAGGNLSVEVGNQGFGALLNLLHGETVTPAKTLTETYTQTHKIGTTDPFKKSMTFQLGRPTVAGVVSPYTYSGSILDSMELSMAASGYLIANMAIAAQDETTATGLAVASYPTKVESFNFTQCILKVNGVEQEFARDLKMTFAKPTDKGRAYLGSAVMGQPLTNAFNAIKLSIDVDYSDTTLYKLFQKNEPEAVEVILTGNKMTTDVTKFSLTFKFPMCRFEGDSPNIADLGILKQSIPLEVEDNGTEAPCTVTYVSSDSAL